VSATPHVIVLAGPNGAGKSTSAPHLLRDAFEVTEFVNADAIASGLSAFRPEKVAIGAGRIMLRRMQDLATARADFAFETTLASRGLAVWLENLKHTDYHVHLLFLWLRSPDLALGRVAERFRQGGHNVPSNVVRRRYAAGLQNFFAFYMHLADDWQFVDNSDIGQPRLVAAGARLTETTIRDADLWHRLKETYHG
jgi:predicted ABC-type ATPase